MTEEDHRNDELWDRIKIFAQKCDLIKKDFQPYDFAVRIWQKKTDLDAKGNLDSHKQNLNEARSLTSEVSVRYTPELQSISTKFVHKSQVTEKIEKTLSKAKKTVIETERKFGSDPSLLLKSWKKVLKYQKEIDYLTQIEGLVQTPSIVFQLVDQGCILEAVNKIKGSLVIIEKDQNMIDIAALQDVKTRLESCKNRVIDIIFDILFKQLFVEERPPNFSFYPRDFKPNSPPEIESSKTRELISALVTLQSTSTFIEQLREQLNLKLAELMAKTAEQIKVKKQRNLSEGKDAFSEFIEVCQSFNPSNPLVSFVDSALCKIWVLLIQCNVIDMSSLHDLEQKGLTLGPAWKVITEEISKIASKFTTTSGNKSHSSKTLTYHFLSADTTPTDANYNNIRIQLGIRPSIYNTLLIYPLVKNFKTLASTALDISTVNDKEDEKFANDSESMIRNRSMELADTPINTRPIRVDQHDAPVFLNASLFIENIHHFIKAAMKFDSLQLTMSGAACDIINAFSTQCEQLFNQINNKNRFYSRSLVNVDEYMRQPLVQKILVLGQEDIDENELNAFFDFEIKNESDLFSGKKILAIEDTVRERFQLPTISSIAESLIYLTNSIRSFLTETNFESDTKLIYEKALRKADDIINTCLIFIHIEMRCRCYAEIVQSLKNTSYKLQTAPQGPDNYATVLTQNYTSNYDRLETCLVQSRHLFVFIGIPKLVYALHIKFLPMVRDINDKGTQAILLNLQLFRQTFSSSPFPDMNMFSKTHWFVSNIYLSPDRILLALKQTKKFFTYEEMAPVFQMHQKQNENYSEALETLSEMFNENND